MKVIIIALIFLFLVGCQNNTTVKEILEDKGSNSMKVTEIIDEKEWGDKKLVLYATEAEGSQMIKVGLLQKKSGKWNFTQGTGHSLTDRPLFARHSSWLTYEGNEINVMYGMINDQNIRSIEVKKENGFEEIPIHETQGRRFFYSPYSWAPVKALNNEGEVIYEEDFK